MTALTRNPNNVDLLQSTKFRITFDRLPGMTYFCQTANLPGISLTEIPKPTPFVEMYLPGEKLTYDTLNITFLVDEDLRAWTQIHDWMRGITFPLDFEEYLNLQKQNSVNNLGQQFLKNGQLSGGQYTDATMTIFTNKNNPNFRVKFVGLFPVSLSTIIFNTGDSADNVVTADATFRFTYYNYERV
jgi:hypothetical protein